MKAVLVVLMFALATGCLTTSDYQPCTSSGHECSSPLTCMDVTSSYGYGSICTERCGTGTHNSCSPGICVDVGGSTPGYCLANCTNSHTCSNGQVCVQLSGSSESACFPRAGAQNVHTYGVCMHSNDCASGSDFCDPITNSVGQTAQICAPDCASATDTCPADANGVAGVCISIGGAFHCAQSCANTPTNCNTGTACDATMHVCLPTVRGHTTPTYVHCSTTQDCMVAGDTCVSELDAPTVTSISFCSSPCTAGGAPCPMDATGTAGTCTSIDGSLHCVQSCTSDAVCVANDVGAMCSTTSHICVPRPPPPPIAVYADCSMASAMGTMCVSSTGCASVTNGTRTLELCTVTQCNSDTQCPRTSLGNGRCIVLDGQTSGTCLQRCNTVSDCAGAAGTESCASSTAGGIALPGPACLPS
jgi:hypothetical protein